MDDPTSSEQDSIATMQLNKKEEHTNTMNSAHLLLIIGICFFLFMMLGVLAITLLSSSDTTKTQTEETSEKSDHPSDSSDDEDFEDYSSDDADIYSDSPEVKQLDDDTMLYSDDDSVGLTLKDGSSIYANKDGSVDVTDGYGNVGRDTDGDGELDAFSSDGGNSWNYTD